MLNLTSGVTQEAFASVATTLTPRIQVYDLSLTGIEDIASEAASIVSGNPTYNPEHSGSVATQMQGFMQQISYYLNQQVNGRYIFAGSRYNTVPVGDITTLGKPTTADATSLAANVSANIPPAYDTQAYQTAQLDIASGSMILAPKPPALSATASASLWPPAPPPAPRSRSAWRGKPTKFTTISPVAGV